MAGKESAKENIEFANLDAKMERILSAVKQMNDQAIQSMWTTALEQNWENARYQDSLRWSRIQTISLIEGAFLYAVYKGCLETLQIFFVSLFGVMLVLVITLLAIKDGNDAQASISRVLKMEKLLLPDIPSFVDKKIFGKLSGGRLFVIAILLINTFNFMILCFNLVKLILI